MEVKSKAIPVNVSAEQFVECNWDLQFVGAMQRDMVVMKQQLRQLM